MLNQWIELKLYGDRKIYIRLRYILEVYQTTDGETMITTERDEFRVDEPYEVVVNKIQRAYESMFSLDSSNTSAEPNSIPPSSFC